MKKIYLFAALAAMLAACSSDELTVEKQNQQSTVEQAVVFDSYINRTTRAGQAGDQKNETLQAATSTLNVSEGFGVFAYYTNNNDYDLLYTPNFMYNQKVWYAGTAFTYSPIKYWPNEYGTTAESEDRDRVSFFAYAPYTPVTPATGKVDGNPEDATWGITGMNRNTATGDPLIKYIASFEDLSKCVDLCWGVIPTSTTWNIIQTNSAQTGLEEGKAWINVERPADPTTGQKLKFNFLHALAKLNVQIDTYVDGVAPSTVEEHTPNTPDFTRVYVRSISFSGFATKGALNLNNATANKPYWMDYAGTNDLVADDQVIFYDGRKDGKEGIAGAIATNEKVIGLNPSIISNDNNTTPGVTGTAVNLFRKGSGDPVVYSGADLTDAVYIIPTEDQVDVTIVYDVETKDENLATFISDGTNRGSSIENRITKTITFSSGSKFEAGKSYVIKLHLGLTSVKFDAIVTGWDEQTPIDVDLPSNVPGGSPVSLTASNPFAEQNVNVAADATSYVFTVTGLTPSTSVTYDKDGTGAATDVVTNVTGDATTNASGAITATATIKPNTKLTKTITGWASAGIGDNGGKIKITQAAAALGLNTPTVSAGNTITLTASNTNISGYWNNSNVTISVKKGGDELFSSVTDTGEVTLSESVTSSDNLTITVKAYDAEEESVSVTVD